ncbi:MAG TPA: GNAT family N-acetyltransferase [Hyphomicrobiaceae bacterium]
MPAATKCRPGRPEEAEALSALCLRSKLHWGYDSNFMRLCEGVLRIDPAAIAEGRVFVVVNEPNDVPLGVAVIALRETDAELTHLFVEPSAIGEGLGAALFLVAMEWTHERGARRLLIASDPNAKGFYERMGAMCVGGVPSESIPGRSLPLLRYEQQVDLPRAQRENDEPPRAGH